MKVELFGLPFDNLTMQETVETVDRFVTERTPRMIFTPNAALIVWARKDPFLREVYRRCDLLPVDGMATYYASRLLRKPLKENCSASTLFFQLMGLADRKRYRIYILGAQPEALVAAVTNLRRDYPGAEIVGTHHGYFAPDRTPAIVEAIRVANADFLFLALSTPMKERFASQYLHVLQTPVILGVGGTIDIAAGLYKFSPRWMRTCCLEWLYRLWQEPRRLWKRYLVTNTMYLYLLGKELLRTYCLPRRLVSHGHGVR